MLHYKYTFDMYSFYICMSHVFQIFFENCTVAAHLLHISTHKTQNQAIETREK